MGSPRVAHHATSRDGWGYSVEAGPEQCRSGRGFGRSSAARSLLQLEEHAFYMVVIKLTATTALLEPEKLSSAKRKQVTVLLQHAPQSLRDCIQKFRVVEPTLSSEEQAEKVLSYCHQICDLNVPIFAQYVPKAPELTGMSRAAMAALLM